ncbi:MAG TPA: flagellar hook capping FlgD N-terminal domain-containing protein [Gammaproteobacteria bacterium]|nr:flagellar hook capping FlgD N-terminal domain-containing protein [Gammaproteobacteria bacterium]
MSALNAPLQPTTSIQPSTAATASSSGSNANSTSGLNSLNEQAFMKLLTTQLQHQDPTQPVQEQQLAAEMAQFSTATGVDTLNNNVSKLISSQQTSALAKASALIGKQVTTGGNALVTDSQGAAHGAFTLPQSAMGVRVNVVDGSGKTVDHVSLGVLGAGTHTFTWNNGSANQAYQFNVTALDSQGNAINATPSSLYTVNGVTTSGNNIELNLAGNPSPLALSQVQQVL